MARSLRPVAEQVMVITGASSGIGLATARMAARPALHRAGYGMHARGTHKGWIRSRSYWVKATTNPLLTGAALVVRAGRRFAARAKTVRTRS